MSQSSSGIVPRWYLVLAVSGCLLVHARSLLWPVLATDDFGIALSSSTWADTKANLWVPTNEHTWPLMRLTTYALLQLAGTPANVPLVLMFFSHALPIAGMLLVWVFVKRETASTLPAAAAMLLFGVSAAYCEAVFWYAACPAVAALSFGLGGLLCAQAWLHKRKPLLLVASLLCFLMAPGWFAGGILLGPIGTLYLARKRQWWVCAVPILGSLAYLAISLPFAAKKIMQAEHYGGKSALEAFQPTTALLSSTRSLVDHTLLGSFGVWNCPMPLGVVIPVAIIMLAGLVWWWKQAPHRVLIELGFVLLLLNNLLIFGARAAWSYEEQLVTWSRYQVFPQLGLALIIAGGIRIRFSLLNTKWFLVAILVQLLLQGPRGSISCYPVFTGQPECLAQIAAVDATCREHGIGRDDALRLLPPRAIPGSADHNRWRFLNGSDNPVSQTDVEILQLLNDAISKYPVPLETHTTTTGE